LKLGLAKLQELGAALIRRQRIFERHLAGFHAAYDFFELRER
jgi:hypothetical protein